MRFYLHINEYWKRVLCFEVNGYVWSLWFQSPIKLRRTGPHAVTSGRGGVDPPEEL